MASPSCRRRISSLVCVAAAACLASPTAAFGPAAAVARAGSASGSVSAFGGVSVHRSDKNGLIARRRSGAYSGIGSEGRNGGGGIGSTSTRPAPSTALRMTKDAVKAGETDRNPAKSVLSPGGLPTVLLDEPLPDDIYQRAIGRTLAWVGGAAVFACPDAMRDVRRCAAFFASSRHARTHFFSRNEEGSDAFSIRAATPVMTRGSLGGAFAREKRR